MPCCLVSLTLVLCVRAVTPCSPGSEVVVNNQRVVETTLLQHGATLRFGRSVWRFIDPGQQEGGGPLAAAHHQLHHGSTATLPGGMDYQVPTNIPGLVRYQ